ncbi:MAG: hypothetical protein IAI49_03070 [Candidatus Eremiobacteraeota bacterium]|nr:hypothetical protein [Candidatus Eremiobacteraeota bacterium]
MKIHTLALALPFAFALTGAYATAADPPRGAAESRAVLRTLNGERTAHRCRRLALDRRLGAIAQAFANDMARRGYFGHTTPEGIDPFERLRRARYAYVDAGENIALDTDAARAHLAIWNEPRHRKIVLQSDFRRVGIGVANSRGELILVEDYSD